MGVRGKLTLCCALKKVKRQSTAHSILVTILHVICKMLHPKSLDKFRVVPRLQRLGCYYFRLSVLNLQCLLSSERLLLAVLKVFMCQK